MGIEIPSGLETNVRPELVGFVWQCLGGHNIGRSMRFSKLVTDFSWDNDNVLGPNVVAQAKFHVYTG